MAVFTCPDCGHSQAVDDKHTGKTATCPQCKAQGAVGKIAETTRAYEQTPEEARTRKINGGNAGIYWLPYGSGEAKKMDTRSSLSLEWIVVDDPRLPVAFSSVCGVRAIKDLSPDRYWYNVKFAVTVIGEAVSAVNLRFLTFDVWGCHVRTLGYTEVSDRRRNETWTDELTWYLGTETEAEQHLASLGYVARVRTREGLIVNADNAFIIREAQRFSEKFTEADLEPKAPEKDS
ncbi:MAG: hypothetical protein HQ464_09420 [Planctomycetes bacterium]|nr:hypothetical protein [Planctomycetota bacterium]